MAIRHILSDGQQRCALVTWIVALSHPQCEFRALQSLVEHGFWAWLPTRSVTRRPRHAKCREITRQYPLYGGGYVFVHEAPHSSISSRHAGVRDLYGIDEVRAVICTTIGDERRPLRIDDDRLDELRHRVENPVPIVEDVLRIGDKIYVTDGPFFTQRGTIDDSDDGKGVLSVLLDLFGRQTRVEMSVEQIARAA